jgi:hypothetical protein
MHAFNSCSVTELMVAPADMNSECTALLILKETVNETLTTEGAVLNFFAAGKSL